MHSGKSAGIWVKAAGARVAIAGLVCLSLTHPLAAQTRNTGAGSEFELAFWSAAAANDTCESYQAYLQQYPRGTFASLAELEVAASCADPVPQQLPPEPLPPEPLPPTPLPPEPVGVIPTAATPVSGAPPAAALPPAALPAESAPMVPPTAPPAPAPLPATAATVALSTAAAPPPDAASARAELQARVGSFGDSTGSAAALIPLPPEPQLASVPDVPIPPTFCSALERNAYHDRVYRPARQVAQDNNRAAIQHLRALQTLYDSYAAERDFERLNAVSDAAMAYEPVADQTYAATVDYDAVFDRLMAVRIVDCGVAGAGE